MRIKKEQRISLQAELLQKGQEGVFYHAGCREKKSDIGKAAG